MKILKEFRKIAENSNLIESWGFVKINPDKNMLVDLKDLIINFKKGIKLLMFKENRRIITSEIKDIEITITTKSGSKYSVNLDNLLSSSDEQKIKEK